MEITSAIRDRIYTAAETLYQEGGRQAFPTVDAVRKLARVNMNDASVGMRAWRRTQAANSETPAVQVPATLQQASIAALNAIWAEAVGLAGEKLKSAQAEWEVERTETEALNQQIANAFEVQAAELANAVAEVEQGKREKRKVEEALALCQHGLEEMKRELISAHAATSQAEVKAAEIAHGADDLRLALDRAHASLLAASEDHAAHSQSQTAEIAALRSEVTDLRRSLQTTEATARSELRNALDEVASLRGKLEATNEMHVLMHDTGSSGPTAHNSERQD